MDTQTNLYILLAFSLLVFITIFSLSKLTEVMMLIKKMRELNGEEKNNKSAFTETINQHLNSNDSFTNKKSSTNDIKKDDDDDEEENSVNISGIVKIFIIGLILSIPNYGWAQEVSSKLVEGNDLPLWILAIIDAAAIIIVIGLTFKIRNLSKKHIAELNPELIQEPKFDLNKMLTDIVDIEDEESILLDHDYDGIKELDNNLPPWWKYGFYLTILIGVIYLLNYHVLKTGDLQTESYNKEIAQANIEVAAYLESQALNVDENSVVFLESADDLNIGAKLFDQYCKVCHGASAEGKIGPNLTDKYWIYGNKINDIFKTLKYGAKNGMKSWKDELNPVEMQQVSSYIMSLADSKPENAKEPQGDLYE